jgi:hypothetical protein
LSERGASRALRCARAVRCAAYAPVRRASQARRRVR